MADDTIPVEKCLAVINKIRSQDEKETVIEKYDKWTTYEEVLKSLKYHAPEVVANTITKYLGDNTDVSILDVAAGTGLAGEELKKCGFQNIDALDPAKGMLQTAMDKNIYKNYIIDVFPCQRECIKTSSYDVLIIVAGMAEGHLKCDCLPETIRCVKPGGLVVILLGERYLTIVAEYKDRLEPLMKDLETKGQWKSLERTVIPKYYHTYNAVLFVFRVTK